MNEQGKFYSFSYFRGFELIGSTLIELNTYFLHCFEYYRVRMYFITANKLTII